MLRRLLDAVHADPYRNLLRDHTLARIAKLFSPRYLRSKAALVAFETLHPDLPWFTRDAIEKLERWLRPTFRGLEWGSGRSSQWLASRSASLVSVEHNPLWYERVRASLAAAGITNVDYRLQPEDDYVRVVDEFADRRFDYVVVDGLFRSETLLRSMRKLRAGGWIVFDNANWYLRSASRTPHSLPLDGPPASPGFERAEREIAAWRATWTTNGVNDTLILVKPEATPVG
ncbi:MAG TPA: class I SAM-dependent methyltransferase [Anaeromyxobacteraceae bacterium]|nr:class I SAM-dependent methyltransferase [Anaeromyxobacteraceae bacterium]